MSIFTKSDLPASPEPTTVEDGAITEAPPDDGSTPARRGRARRIAAWALTGLAGLFVFVALVAPDQHTRMTLGSFVRIPVEGLIGAALLLVLPGRARKIVAALIGAFLGLLILVQALDFGFWTSLNRQFDLVADWGLLDDGVSFLRDAVGRTGANIAVVCAVVLAIAVVVFMALSMIRLSRIAARHRTRTAYGIAVLAVAWVACAMLGAQFVAGVPVAAHSEADLVHSRALMVQAGLRDKKAFAAAIAADKFHDTPADELLTGLRGKDVIVSFVESYGRSALEDPQQAAIVDPALAAGTQQLKAAGFSARSGFLTSSTFGGYSWLAHSTFQSGLLINGQQRYRTLVSTDRLTLTSAFRRAGWQTVAVEPDNTYVWPEGAFYGYERVYDSRNLGYAGPHFGWSTMPDQYTLSEFQRREYGKPHAPMMAEITLTSSHTPWAPIPQLVDWNAVGNGAIYGAQEKAGNSPESVWKDSNKVRTEYAKSIAYSVGSLISWAEKYGNDNLVLIFFGDHQASSIVSGKNATRDVPITIVAHDPAVLDKMSAWGWQDGLRPNPQAPVMPMESFRDRFLATFGSQPTER
ncbi:MAG TPA: sulfatase-like hydrolase/transferase [Actinoplanes sp.]|nr:sulfatase-like hydrolase/transferase [Actinoplanes sp.]